MPSPAVEGLKVFSNLKTDEDVENVGFFSYRASDGFESGGPLVYSIAGSEGQFVDLQATRHYVKVQINKKDGSRITDEDVAFVNQPLHSMFSDVKVFLQQVEVCNGLLSGTYPFKADIDNKLAVPGCVKESLLTQQGYYKDSTGRVEGFDPLNAGLQARKKLTANGLEAEFYGPVYVDLLQELKNFLLPKVNVRVEFIPKSSKFCLIYEPDGESETDGSKYVYKIIASKLIIRKLIFKESIRASYMERLKTTNAKYHFRHTKLKVYNLLKGRTDFYQDDVFQTLVPTNIVICFVDADAYSGKCNKNPFNYKNHNLHYAACLLDGQTITGEALRFDFQKKQYIEGYNTLFDFQGINDLDITREDYENGSTIICFNIDPSHHPPGSGLAPKDRRGNIQLDLRFGELETSVNIIVYASFLKRFEIDHCTNIITGDDRPYKSGDKKCTGGG